MKERPMLFSGPMVRAIINGRKSVTRREVKSDWIQSERAPLETSPGVFKFWCSGEHACPYGCPGDQLWVREAWARIRVAQAPDQEWVVYRECDNRTDFGGPWKPSIHMRRRDSRILLEITAVRVERLQEISEYQAKSEGVQKDHRVWFRSDEGGHAHQCAVDAFADLWCSINGAESWGANPWVWVVEFKRVEAAHG